MNWFFILLLFEIFLFILAYIISGKDIMAPSVIFCVMFFISSIFCIPYIERWKIYYGIESFAIIVVGIFSFIFAEFLTRIFCKRITGNMKADYNKPIQENNNWPVYDFNHIFFIAVIAFNAVILILYLLDILRVTKSSGMSGSDITKSIALYRHISVGGTTSLNIDSSVNRLLIHLIKLVKSSGFVAQFILISNVMVKYKKNRSLYIIIIIQSVLPGLISGGRTEAIRLLSAILADYNILWHQRNGWYRNNSAKFIKIGLCTLSLGIPIFYFLGTLIGRGGQNIFETSAVYLGSGIALFNVFCNTRSSIKNLFFGEESLFGIYELLSNFGFNFPSRNVALEFQSSGELVSNLYTFFRRPLNDFGIIGMCVFTGIIAAAFSWLYFYKIKDKKRNYKTDIFSLIYGFMFYWIISASSEQRSVNYFSADYIEIMVLIIIEYKLVCYLSKHMSHSYK